MFSSYSYTTTNKRADSFPHMSCGWCLQDIVVCTPGRLMQHVEDGSVFLGDVQYLVLDEAVRVPIGPICPLPHGVLYGPNCIASVGTLEQCPMRFGALPGMWACHGRSAGPSLARRGVWAGLVGMSHTPAVYTSFYESASTYFLTAPHGADP